MKAASHELTCAVFSASMISRQKNKMTAAKMSYLVE